MEFAVNLWIPILAATFVLWLLSTIFWTALPHHENDFSKLPDEDQLMSAVREANVPPGRYMFPFLRHADMKDPAMVEKYKNGPRGTVVLWDIPNMGKNIGLTILYFFIISVVMAYIAWESLSVSPDKVGFMRVYQIVGAMGLLVYCSSGQLHAIWFPRRMRMDFLDGIAYGVATGLVFALLWPAS
jgi:hypothetical protein